jgi:sigma-B regulation protein RsbU (phosphoserine phosphatase)
MTPSQILVVDDEPDISTILTLTLRRAGYVVTTARDGVDALEKIAAKPPDLVLLDSMMPRLDGLETLRRLRAETCTARMPVIMLTAKAKLTDRMAGFERGADDYVAKPFDPAEVLARVQSLLRRTEQTRLTSPLLNVLGQWSSAEGLAQFGRDLEAAREIQLRLLPEVPPVLAGLQAAAILHPSTVVGGDFLDVIAMGDRLGVAIGDVAGKGIPAALLMVMVRTLLREIAAHETSPAAALRRLNVSLCRDMPPNKFVTVALAVVDPGRPGHVVIANGGHPPPLIVRHADVPLAVAGGDMMVGAFAEATFDEIEVTLAAGDSLVLVTDGALENPDANGRRPGLAGLVNLLDTCRSEPAAAIARAVAEAGAPREGAGLHDDLAVVVLQRR